jgi:hypothetical protein
MRSPCALSALVLLAAACGQAGGAADGQHDAGTEASFDARPTPDARPDGGSVEAGHDSAGPGHDAAHESAAPHKWLSGFLMSATIDDDYGLGSSAVSDAETYLSNIGQWRTGTSTSNVTVFNANAYPDPGSQPNIVDYCFGTLTGSHWGLPARWVPSMHGIQPVWSTGLTVGSDSLADTVAGKGDASFKAWFEQLVAYGQQDAIVRLGWELNGYWFTWAIADPTNMKQNGGTVAGAAAAYNAAYRHVVDLARAVPGQAFKFEFNSAYITAKFDGGVVVTPANVDAAYPGNTYVDYVGTDLYDSSWVSGTPTVVESGPNALPTGSISSTNLSLLTGWKGPSGRFFAATDVGKSIQVYGAGPNGASTTAAFPLFAKVTSVDTTATPPTATLNVAASRAVSGVPVALFDDWPSAAFTDSATGFNAYLAAFAAYGATKGRPLGISEWAYMLRMDGHGGNDDPTFIQTMYDFFASETNNVAYETHFMGIDGNSFGIDSQTILYPMMQRAVSASVNGPFHDTQAALPLTAAKYKELFGPL